MKKMKRDTKERDPRSVTMSWTPEEVKNKLALVIKEHTPIPINTLVEVRKIHRGVGLGTNSKYKLNSYSVEYKKETILMHSDALIVLDKDKAPSEFVQHQFKEFLTLVNNVKNAYYNLVQDGEDFSFPEMIEKVTEKHAKRMSDELENKMFEE